MYKFGNIHEIIKTLEPNSIDFIYTDPPFGTTGAKWDKKLDWEKLFPEMWRVLKPKGTICLYASMPFTYELLKYETPKYHYNWKKNNSTGFFQARFQPLRCMEEIFIYYKKAGTYNPQMVGNEEHGYRNVKIGSKENDYYNQYTDKKYDEKKQGKSHKGRFPTTFKDWKIRKDKSGITRTDEQIDYFIKTYTNEGDNILDMTCCNHYVGDRAKALNRNYLGVDLIDFSKK